MEAAYTCIYKKKNDYLWKKNDLQKQIAQLKCSLRENVEQCH